jgi:uncharacterized low-complexity protein
MRPISHAIRTMASKNIDVASATSPNPVETGGQVTRATRPLFTLGEKKMSNKMIKPLSIAVGVAFVGSLAIAQAASASSFSLTDLDSGYQQVGEGHEHDKSKEGACGEGKCGIEKLDADKNGSVSAAEFAASGHPADHFAKIDADKDGNATQAEFDAAHKAKEGSCGEGKCGGDKAKEGSCGGEKAKEGSCGGQA